jgi:glycogen synthase
MRLLLCFVTECGVFQVFESGGPDVQNGFVFEPYSLDSYKDAVMRAVSLYKDGDKYAMLRRNALKSVVDVRDVAMNWLTAFADTRHRFVTFSDTLEAEAAKIKDEL